MKEITLQLFTIWKDIKPLQKFVVVTIVLFTSFVLGYLVIQSIAGKRLEKIASVEEDQLIELSCSNGAQKGFELFDTNTWIKGDKELQVLEMRALKGQLEKDLAGFDQIKNACVILDMSPGRGFGGSKSKTKASVILTLTTNTPLSISQMKAVTYHLAGAVHGLEPNMIAISDTTGKLYKVIDPEGEEEILSNTSLAFEEHLEQKIRAFMTPLINEEHYFCSVQAIVDKGKKQPSSLSIAVTIDKEHEGLVETIKHQLNTIASGYEVSFHLAVDAISFEKKKGLWIETKEKGDYSGLILTVMFVVVALLCLYPFFRRYSKQKQEDTIFKVMTRIDIDKLAESIKDEDPQTIALMLSYLEPTRAEQLIASFPEESQEKILNNLSELEYDNY